MRVFRECQAWGGTGIRVSGENAAVLARTLERPIGRGGGLRDPAPKVAGSRRGTFQRDRYVSVAVARDVQAWVQRQALNRGLSLASFLGQIIEASAKISDDELDDFLSR